MSAISSAPSGIPTPTLEVLSNTRNLNPAERLWYERKKRFASHGYSDGKMVRKSTQGPTGPGKASGPTSKTDGLDGSEHW